MSRPRPRPLTTDELRSGPAILRALADEWERTDARRTQQNLATAIDDGYSATASGAGSQGGGGGSTTLTVVEAKASKVDPLVTRTVELLLAQQRVIHDANLALNRLAEWRGDRSTGLCAEGHELKAGQVRCTWEDPDTGRRCGTRRETILRCENPYHVNPDGEQVKLLTGERRWKVVALDLDGQPEISECARCRSFRRRNQRSWGSALRLTVPGVNELGAFHSEEPWAEQVVG